MVRVHRTERSRDPVAAAKRRLERDRRARADLDPRISAAVVIDIQVGLRRWPGEAQIAAFVNPTIAFVRTLLFIPAREIAVAAVFRVAVFVGQNARRVGVMNDVLMEVEIVFNQMPDQSAEKHNVCARADWHPNIGQRARPRETWIHVDDCGAAFLRLHHPAKTDRMRLGH